MLRTVKVQLSECEKTFLFSSDVTYDVFYAHLHDAFGLTEPISVTYTDSEDDVITVSSDIELTELLLHHAPGQIKITLSLPSKLDSSPSSNGQPGTCRASGRDASTENFSFFLAKMTELLDVIGTPFNAAEFASLFSRKKTISLVSTSYKRSPAPRAEPVCSGPLSGLKQYLLALPSGKARFAAHIKSISPEIKAAFRKLSRHILRSEQCEHIIATLQAATPLLRLWIDGPLGVAGTPLVATVDELIADTEAYLSPRIGLKLTKRVTELAGAAIAEPPVVAVLRELRGHGPMPWEASVTHREERSEDSDDTFVLKRSYSMLQVESSEDVVVEPRAKKRKGLYAGLKPFMSAFPSGKAALRNHFVCLPSTIKSAFRRLVRLIATANDCSLVVAALKDCSPVLRIWIREELGKEGVPTIKQVNSLVAEAKAVMLQRIGYDFASHVEQFARIALAEEGVTEILREIDEIEQLPWEGSHTGSSHNAAMDLKDAYVAPSDAAGSLITISTTRVEETVSTCGHVKISDKNQSIPKASHRTEATHSATTSPDGVAVKVFWPQSVVEEENLMSIFCKSCQSPAVIDGVRDTLPTFKSWLEETRKNREAPKQDQVDSFIKVLHEKVIQHIGEQNQEVLTNFIRAVLADGHASRILYEVCSAAVLLD